MERNKKSNRINENKKGDSSLISMVLLIGLSIALSALIFSYSNFEVNKQIQDFTKLKESTQFINLKIKNAEVQDFNSLSLLLQKCFSEYLILNRKSGKIIKVDDVKNIV